MYKQGDPVHVVDNTHYELPDGTELFIPAGTKVEVDAFHPNGATAMTVKSSFELDQVSFFYQGQEVRIGAWEVAKLSS
ncbi:MAG: hypothetical protein V4474_02170 [Patescibacteria group bacterium]